MLVRNLTIMFGEHAGKIWQILNETGNASEMELKDSLRLSKTEFYSGVGWLARENKIKKVNDSFELDSTNLTEEVGSAAGKVWKILNVWDEADLIILKKLSGFSEEEVYAALGWLAREGKITHKEGFYSLTTSK